MPELSIGGVPQPANTAPLWYPRYTQSLARSSLEKCGLGERHSRSQVAAAGAVIHWCPQNTSF